MEKFIIKSYPDYDSTRNTLLEAMPDTPMELIDHFILNDIIEWNIEASEIISNLDLYSISGFKNIGCLDISICKRITDLSPLIHTNIKNLFMGGCTVSDLSPLIYTGIQKMTIYNCTRISDLSPLEHLKDTLKILNIGRTAVSNLSPLANMKVLKELDMNHCTGITDLSPLTNITTLKLIHMFECTGISDLSPLENIPTLEYIDMRQCNPTLNTTRLEERGVTIDK